MTDKKAQALAREVTGLHAMFTRSLTRRINVENAMGPAMSNKLWRVIELAEDVLAAQAKQEKESQT